MKSTPTPHESEAAIAAPAAHRIKIDPERFDEVVAGSKTHEVRSFDRDYQVGQILELHSFDRKRSRYDGRVCRAQVTNITAPGSYGLPGHIGVMSVRLLELGAGRLVRVQLSDTILFEWEARNIEDVIPGLGQTDWGNEKVILVPFDVAAEIAEDCRFYINPRAVDATLGERSAYRGLLRQIERQMA